MPDYTLIHKVSIRQTHARARAHARTHTKHSSKSSNAAEIFFPPSPPIQGCFYGNKLQFLAQKSGNLQEVRVASRRRAGGWLEDRGWWSWAGEGRWVGRVGGGRLWERRVQCMVATEPSFSLPRLEFHLCFCVVFAPLVLLNHFV